MTKATVDLTDYLSWQSVALLDQLAALGIYGVSRQQVAARFVDQGLVDITSRDELRTALQSEKLYRTPARKGRAKK